jgi:hypothetical protein
VADFILEPTVFVSSAAMEDIEVRISSKVRNTNFCMVENFDDVICKHGMPVKSRLHKLPAEKKATSFGVV